MPSTGYYYVKGERVTLEREPSVYAVRLRGGIREDSPQLSQSARRVLRDDSESIGFIPKYGLRIMKLSRADASETVERLDDEPAVDLAVTAYRRAAGAQELMFTTRQFVVQFKPGVTREQIDALNAQYGVRLIEPVGYMANGFLLEAPAGEGDSGPVALANTYFESGHTVSATPDFVRQVHYRQSTAVLERSGPVTAREGEYLAQQWHLALAKVPDAWQITIGESSIVIAVLDDGIDVDHTEFAGKVVGQFDFEAQVSDARPKTASDNHGTACAGMAVALGAKAHGSAPGCSLLAVRTPSYLGVADEAEMFRWVTDAGADVISCSWGPADGTGVEDPLPDNVRAAIHYCLTDGRGGKGIPIVWAAGNGAESVSLDGYAANPDVMAIAASTSKEGHAWYSDYGPEVWVCAPSSGKTSLGEKRVFSTDRHGAEGYNKGTAQAGDAAGDYTNDFGGTSAATPLVAGIIGLMLSKAPQLTCQQVRDILRTTADRIGPASEYNSSGHSPNFGFGRVNARKAVDAAAAGGSGGNPLPTGGPSITGPARADRAGSAPTFRIDLGGNTLHAVEVGTSWQMFAGGEQTPETFYASWADGPLLSDPAFQLPDDVWERMRCADRLYYRVHTARDGAWTGWEVSTPDSDAASAPSIELTGAVNAGGVVSGGPSITGPAQAGRDGGPPRFTVDPRPNSLYAVELAADWQLFTAADSERASNRYYATWNDSPLLSGATFQLPESAWHALCGNAELYYRVHTAQDNAWTGWQVSTSDDEASSAPCLRIVAGGTRSVRDNGIAVGDQAARFPSGAVFPPVGAAEGDYSDPVTGGVQALIEVGERLDEALSADFTARAFAAPSLEHRGEPARYARIAPSLVSALQAIRDAVKEPVYVASAYRYPALNTTLGGSPRSRHLAGQAADIHCAATPPLELARLALTLLGPDIGLGLGPDVLHLDLRGEPANWVYADAPLTAAEFDSWVRGHIASLGTGTPRPDAWARMRPSITGPATATAAAPAPTFTIAMGTFAYYAVEVATNTNLLTNDLVPLRTEGVSSHASWAAGPGTPVLEESTTYTLPQDIWKALAPAGRLYYRVLASQKPITAESTGLSYSTTPQHAEDTPSIVVNRDSGRTAPEERLLDPAMVRRVDESLWRNEPSAGRGRRM